jgi:ABC-2 type transport system permease protein
MLSWIRTELFKMARRPRSYIGLGAIAALVLLIEFAMYVDGEDYLKFILQQLESYFTIEGNVLNGYTVCFVILQTLILQMPLLVALITGDALSGEAALGTLRFMLSTPVTRTGLVLAKYLAGSVYVAVLLLFLGVLALYGSMALFGTGDLIILKSESLIILKEADIHWRFLTAFLLAFVSLSVIAALSMMLSAFSNNSIGPIVMSMAIVIVFTIVGSLEFPLFDSIRPFLFTSYMTVWRDMFDDPLNTTGIFRSVVILVLHIGAFLSVAIYHLNKKDIQV